MADIIKITCEYSKSINYAMQQNSFSVIRNIQVLNTSDTPYEDVILKVTFNPEFAKEYIQPMACLNPGEFVIVSPVKINLIPEFLISYTEKISGFMTIEILKDDNILARCEEDIELLAYDEWLGTSKFPELVCAYITPNHPSVTKLLHEGLKYLKEWTGNTAYTGYQTQNPDIVKKQMGAIYAALQEERIGYIVPPASYETLGQRIRMPHDVLDKKLGTCLDLSILYASALEAIGLAPLLVFFKGHALVACHLADETSQDMIIDEPDYIINRMAKGIDSIACVECTDFVADKGVEFDESEEHVRERFSNRDDFVFAICVKRARNSGIRPIPIKVDENGRYVVDTDEQSSDKITSAPSDIIHRSIETEKREMTKQDMWERKLLDMSLRNQLLNFRPGKNAVQLGVNNIADVENKLIEGMEFKLAWKPSDITGKLNEAKVFVPDMDKATIQNIIISEYESKRIITFLDEDDMGECLKNISRKAKSSFEENGCNTLYLALGFLKWYETDISEKPRYAPLVLIPVDIVKKISQKTYAIKVRDEDTQMNITLLEMLRQNFDINIEGLDPLPQDEHGTDMAMVMQVIREGIIAKKRWAIEEIAFMGIFSFSQFIMWNDIRNRSDELKQNKIVSSLMEGKLTWEPIDTGYSLDNIDELVSADNTAIPTSADSSQLLAICEAGCGQSLVLHGPPGTGKSQTITNMIANALYNGKTVLFVAEKQAALNVVKNRLDKIGLGPFCLELHSNKAQKRAVLSQLEKTLESTHIKKPEEYENTANKLLALRKELNQYVAELHKIRNYGYSLYDIIAIYEDFKEYGGKIKFDKSLIDGMNNQSLSDCKDAINKLKVAIREYGQLNPSMVRYKNSTYSMHLKEELSADIKNVIDVADELFDEYNEFLDYLGVNLGFAYKDYVALSKLVEYSKANNNLISIERYDSLSKENHEKLVMVLEKGIKRQTDREDILKEFNEGVFSVDATKAKENFKAFNEKWFLAKAFSEKKVLAELGAYSKRAGFINVNNIESYYDKLIAYKFLDSEVIASYNMLSDIFGDAFKGNETDFNSLYDIYRETEKFKAFVDEYPEISGIATNYMQKKDEDNKGFSEQSEKYMDTYNRFMGIYGGFVEKYKFTDDDLKENSKWLSSVKSNLTAISDDMSRIREWTNVLLMLREVRQVGLVSVTNAYLNGEITADNIYETFMADICKEIIINTIDSSEILLGFSGSQFEETIRNFEKLDKENEKLTINELVARLSEKVPDIGKDMAASSEVGILQKAIKSGARAMSIRKLFDSTKNLLRRICPCMLMSPISVAQYIDPTFPKFDLVIFDEASQLPTSEAVGAIARGDNCVVVGDPKQLPPTSFFMTQITDEENEDKEDLESVLDDCLAISMPQRHLLWHYRSRHESLIAYSNAKYYDNKLFTFPSPNDLVSEVKFFNVDGCYDKSKTKTNVAEAKAIVEEIVRRLKDEKLKHDSIGVVTFSVVQQNLIEDMLSEAFAADPELEKAADEMYEPILIKNLENVQGDERDVILFSICYGPDKDGNVSMNFGPINRDGGWRRLNVAISRSRKEMQVYSTIRPEQIDLSRTSSAGVEGLKGFLEFAARGRNVLPVRNTETAKNKSGMEHIIAAEIKKLGYDCRCNIGCSEYKIDIGVVDPDDNSKYLLGIMIDGETYAKSATARDRNILQPSVLKGLGWKLFRVWTMDFVENRDKVIASIKNAIEGKEDIEEVQPESVKEELVFEREEVLDNSSYNRYIPYTCDKKHDSEDFYNEDYMCKTEELVYDILHAEAPISKTLLGKRLMEAFGISRNSTRVSNRLEAIYQELKLTKTSSGYNEFFWDDGQVNEMYDNFRVPSGSDKRPIEDIAPEEIKSAIKKLMECQISIGKPELIKEIVKLFGFQKTTDAYEEIIGEAIELAVKKNYITEEGNNITLCK